VIERPGAAARERGGCVPAHCSTLASCAEFDARPLTGGSSRNRGPDDGRCASDAFVFFGHGDLASNRSSRLAGLVRDEGFDLPIIGVARSGDLDTLRERARQSLAAAGVVDRAAVDAVVSRLRYVKGSDDDVRPSRAAAELGKRAASPPLPGGPAALFGQVVTNLALGLHRRRAGHPREAVRARPRERHRLNATVHEVLAEPGSSGSTTTGQGAGPEPAVLPVRQLVPGAALEPTTSRVSR